MQNYSQVLVLIWALKNYKGRATFSYGAANLLSILETYF